MKKNSDYKTFISLLPELFNTGAGLEQHFFLKLKSIVDFENASVFILNPNLITRIYSFIGEDKKDFKISNVLSKKIFGDDILVNKDFNKVLNIKDTIFFSKLMIKNVVFGFVIFERSDFSDDEKHILDVFCKLLSYKIKDMELSEIFKLQLNTLSSAVLETKKANKMIELQNEKLLSADKIKSEFLANVSHELRTPLNSIIGFSELLANPRVGELNKKQQDYVLDIRTSALHLLGMINGILDISKLESDLMQLNCTRFNVALVVDEVLNILFPLFEKKSLNLSKNIIDDVEINADYQKIQQILFNLLSNAIKFTPENGKITISVYKKNKQLYLEIKDTGIGIEAKNHKKIFEKFIQLNDYSTKKESSTGLGLTITRELINMHGGKISLKSKLNKGATFTVKLPIN